MVAWFGDRSDKTAVPYSAGPSSRKAAAEAALPKRLASCHTNIEATVAVVSNRRGARKQCPALRSSEESGSRQPAGGLHPLFYGSFSYLARMKRAFVAFITVRATQRPPDLAVLTGLDSSR